jgi:predicted metal-dependent phosphoesterase TrpH
MSALEISADLHAHTTASYGELTPTELIAAAKAAGVGVLAVTDHDTTGGVAEATLAAEKAGIRLVPGVELSAEGAPGKCHLLGLNIDPADAALIETLTRISEARRVRNDRMAARLRSLGVDITLDEVTAAAPRGANVGRPHFAALLIAKGAAKDNTEAFARFLSDDGPAYVEKETLSPAEAIRLIQGAGGRCFLAHPGLLRLARHETFETRLRDLKALGIDGLEAYYGKHSPVQNEQFVRLADKLGLMVTGGSDFHGPVVSEARLNAVLDGQPLPARLLQWL